MCQVTPSARQSDRLLTVLSEFRQVVIIMHDNPDPDAIASGWAINVLVQEKLGLPVRLLAGGAIVRAENRHMVDLLNPPIELVSELRLGDETAAILVDCGLGTTNHLATRSGIEPIGVIDHHLNGSARHELRFMDIRTDVAAAASIAASYLRDHQVEPGVKLATAILYGIRTETCGGETKHSTLDRSTVNWATQLADPTLLAEIENAPLDRDYYGDLILAMQVTMVYEDTALCFLPRATSPEIVGEVADLLARCRGIRRVLCAAILGVDLVLSARTERGSGNAARLLQATLGGLGGCGGHAHRAGGKVPAVGKGRKVEEDLHDELRIRWLKACSVNCRRGTRLVARHDIVKNL